MYWLFLIKNVLLHASVKILFIICESLFLDLRRFIFGIYVCTVLHLEARIFKMLFDLVLDFCYSNNDVRTPFLNKIMFRSFLKVMSVSI